MIATYLGLFFMVTQLQLPGLVTQTVRYISNCNSAITMFIVGTYLLDVDLRTILNRDTAFYCALRLVILPCVALAIGFLLGVREIALGVCVLMSGMPAGSTASIFAAKYDGDATFATQCIVISVLVSMVTIPIFCYLIA